MRGRTFHIYLLSEMLDTLRTRVLTTAIDIKTKLEKTGVDLNHLSVKQQSPESEKAQRIINNNIFSGQVFFTSGDISQHTTQNVAHTLTQNIEAGNWDSYGLRLRSPALTRPRVLNCEALCKMRRQWART